MALMLAVLYGPAGLAAGDIVLRYAEDAQDGLYRVGPGPWAKIETPPNHLVTITTGPHRGDTFEGVNK